MITVPLWLFATLCALAVLSLLAAVSAWLRAQRTVDRILAKELAHPMALGAETSRDNAPVVTVAEGSGTGRVELLNPTPSSAEGVA